MIRPTRRNIRGNDTVFDVSEHSPIKLPVKCEGKERDLTEPSGRTVRSSQLMNGRNRGFRKAGRWQATNNEIEFRDSHLLEHRWQVFYIGNENFNILGSR